MAYRVFVELDGPARGRLDAAPFAALCERLLDAEGASDGSTAALLIAGDELLWRLNREYRDVDEPTDVLSFPAAEAAGEPAEEPSEEPSDGDGPYLGDIAVSVDMARRQADEAGLSLDDELRHLVVHGMLHLLGYEHDTTADEVALRAREEALLGAAIHAGRGHDESH